MKYLLHCLCDICAFPFFIKCLFSWCTALSSAHGLASCGFILLFHCFVFHPLCFTSFSRFPFSSSSRFLQLSICTLQPFFFSISIWFHHVYKVGFMKDTSLLGLMTLSVVFFIMSVSSYHSVSSSTSFSYILISFLRASSKLFFFYTLFHLILKSSNNYSIIWECICANCMTLHSLKDFWAYVTWF